MRKQKVAEVKWLPKRRQGKESECTDFEFCACDLKQIILSHLSQVGQNHQADRDSKAGFLLCSLFCSCPGISVVFIPL